MSIIDLFNYDNIPEQLHLKVTPKAKFERIKTEERPDGSICYRVYVTAAAEDGKANKAVIALLAKEMRLPKSAFIITHGLTSRNKIVKILK